MRRNRVFQLKRKMIHTSGLRKKFLGGAILVRAQRKLHESAIQRQPQKRIINIEPSKRNLKLKL